MEIYSANEYWVKAASLFHTNTQGTADLPGHPQARHYFMSSMQHGTGNGNAKGNCQQFENPLDSEPVQRALFVALDDWVDARRRRRPRACRGSPTARWCRRCRKVGDGLPEHPGRHLQRAHDHALPLQLRSALRPGHHGPEPSRRSSPPYQNNPLNGPIYNDMIPKTDADGNDIAGVRLPDVRVPLNTYTGWALRPRALGENDGCEGSGQRIPFPATKAAREASGDPRLSSRSAIRTSSTTTTRSRRR